MKRLFVFLLFAVVLQNVFSQSKDIGKLKKLNQDWLNLSLKKDTAAFAKIFADDFILISPNGSKITKSEGVRNILYQDIESINIDIADVRLLTMEKT